MCLGGWGVEETNKHRENGIPKLHPQGFIVSKDQWKPSCIKDLMKSLQFIKSTTNFPSISFPLNPVLKQSSVMFYFEMILSDTLAANDTASTHPSAPNPKTIHIVVGASSTSIRCSQMIRSVRFL